MWNYRILAKPYEAKLGSKIKKGITFGIYDVYYDKETKIPHSYGESMAICTEDAGELKDILDLYRKATEKPILWCGERFPQEYTGENCSDHIWKTTKENEDVTL